MIDADEERTSNRRRFYDQSKESFFHTGIFLLPGGRGDVHGAVSAGSQPDGVVFWYDCLSGMAGL